MGPPSEHCDSASTVHVATADGAEIALHRHSQSALPVLVIHGISSNHRFWDLTEGHSLAEMLTAANFDPWLIDLRGHGEALYTRQGLRQHHGWTIDDYGMHDVAAAVAHIQAATGHKRVAIVGHSMGGMVAAIYAAHHGDDSIAALVMVGAPVVFPDDTAQTWLGKAMSQVGGIPPSVATPAVARFMAGWHPALPVHGEAILFNASNMAESMQHLMLTTVVSPTTRGEVRQLNRMMKAGRLVSADGSVDYTAALGSVDVPLLAIAGGKDRIVPLAGVKQWASATASADVTVKVASKANGFVADYGHLDLVLGPAAPREVLRPIAEWLNGHRTNW